MGGLYMTDNGAFNYTEYLQAELTDPLVPGEPYLVSPTSPQPDAVHAMCAFMRSPAAAAAKRANGMEPA